MNESEPPARRSLTKALSDAGLPEAITEAAESVLGSVAGDLLPHVPIAGIGFAVARSIQTVRERFFLDKLVRFLGGYSTLDDSSKARIQDASTDRTHQQTILDQTILALDRLDEVDKCNALFNLLTAVTLGEITQRQFRQFVRSLELIEIGDLEVVSRFYDTEVADDADREILRAMLPAKLISVDYSGRPTSGQLWPRSGGGDERFLPNVFGAQFVRIVTRTKADVGP